MQRIFIFVLIWVLWCAGSYAQSDNRSKASASTGLTGGAGALKLLRVTPQGDNVPAGQQIVFQFDRAVVPVGRMDRKQEEIPVSVSPALNCEWRWLNTSALACQLAQADKMKLATTYKVIVQSVIATEAGEALAGSFHHKFTTMRPQVTYTRFRNWFTPSTPLIQVTFNQPVTQLSVENSLMFFTGRESTAGIALQAFPDHHARNLFWLARADESTPDAQATLVISPDQGNDKQTRQQARRIWYVEPVKPLPEGQKIQLKVRPGLISGEGSAEGQENRTVVSFDTYPAFQFVLWGDKSPRDALEAAMVDAVGEA